MLGFYPPEQQAHIQAQVDTDGDGWLLPPTTWADLAGTPTGDGLTPDHLARKATPQPWANPEPTLSQPWVQPWATYTQPLDLPNGLPGAYGRVLIACHDSRALEATGIPELQFASHPGWTRHDLQTGHWPMLSTPTPLSES